MNWITTVYWDTHMGTSYPAFDVLNTWQKVGYSSTHLEVFKNSYIPLPKSVWIMISIITFSLSSTTIPCLVIWVWYVSNFWTHRPLLAEKVHGEVIVLFRLFLEAEMESDGSGKPRFPLVFNTIHIEWAGCYGYIIYIRFIPKTERQWTS